MNITNNIYNKSVFANDKKIFFNDTIKRNKKESLIVYLQFRLIYINIYFLFIYIKRTLILFLKHLLNY